MVKIINNGVINKRHKLLIKLLFIFLAFDLLETPQLKVKFGLLFFSISF